MKETYRFSLDIGFVGATKTKEITFDFDDDATDDDKKAELNEALEDWKDENCSYWAEKVTK